MSAFNVYAHDNAPEASQPILGEVKKAFGFVPNLQANMAESPELLAGYTALWDLFAKSSLTPHEQQVVYLTSNFENNCHYCMAGHTTLARMIKMDAGVIDALHRFTTLVVRERGFVSEADVDAFLAAGYTRRNVLEVVLGVATKVISNYTNHLVDTQLDKFMAGNEWTKPVQD